MDDTHEMIKDCLNWYKKMNPWEQEFTTSIDERFTKYGKLSPAQLDKLEAIWEKVTK